MALVIFFVPEPAKGVAEMVRVVRPGGWVASYAWDVPGADFRWSRSGRRCAPWASSPSGRRARRRRAWTCWASYGQAPVSKIVETKEITVHRTFADFETCWTTTLLGASVGPMVAKMTPGERDEFKEGVRAQASADADGRITLAGRANAIKGHVPK